MLIRFADRLSEVTFSRSQALIQELQRDPPSELKEWVPGFTTLLLEFDLNRGRELTSIARELLPRLELALGHSTPERSVQEIPVLYDGEDLERIAILNQLTIPEVIQLHAAPIYRVYLLGFAPGFPYLGDLDSRLHTPRQPIPRTRVRAGSVAIGGAHTGIYSVDSPGGWNIIGHTPIQLFNPTQLGEDMFFLQPGDRVKFIPEAKL